MVEGNNDGTAMDVAACGVQVGWNGEGKECGDYGSAKRQVAEDLTEYINGDRP